MPAFRTDRFAVDEECDHRRRRLQQVPRCDDHVGTLAGFERSHLIGDAQDLRRREGDGLERHLLRQTVGDGGGRLVRQVPRRRLST